MCKYINIVSVVMPTYNSENFLEEAIKSVLAQTMEEFELIIVDDCSTDSSAQIARKFASLDNRVKSYVLDKNSGAAVARNTAIENAKGRYIAFLDSDDLWLETKLEKQIEFMTEKKAGLAFSAYKIINESGEDLNKIIEVPDEITYTQLLKNTIIGCLTVVIDREIVGEFKMPLVRAGQDTATWLSILRQGNIAYGNKEILAKYRIVEGSISSNKLKALKRTWNTYRNIEKLSLLKSCYYFSSYVKNAILKRL